MREATLQGDRSDQARFRADKLGGYDGKEPYAQTSGCKDSTLTLDHSLGTVGGSHILGIFPVSHLTICLFVGDTDAQKFAECGGISVKPACRGVI